ncbi:hypothetical protein YC2023_086224 [Brassica napus]
MFFDEFVIEYLDAYARINANKGCFLCFWPYPPFSQLPAYRVRFAPPLTD